MNSSNSSRLLVSIMFLMGMTFCTIESAGELPIGIASDNTQANTSISEIVSNTGMAKKIANEGTQTGTPISSEMLGDTGMANEIADNSAQADTPVSNEVADDTNGDSTTTEVVDDTSVGESEDTTTVDETQEVEEVQPVDEPAADESYDSYTDAS